MGRFDGAAVDRLERMYCSGPIIEQRSRTRAALAIRPGERGLEVGCGPGLLACEMAHEVGPRGRIEAIDASVDMIEASRARANREGISERLNFQGGQATHLEFADASFDFVVGVQVYLYVKEIEKALAEAARVLKPGGRLLIVDTDWDSCVWLTSDRERHRRVMEARVREFSQPHLPPLLPRLLAGAGLAMEAVESIPVLNLRYDPESFSGGIVDGTPGLVAKRGFDRAEADAWAADLRGRTAEGEYFFSLNRYLFRARRPA